MDHCLHKSPAVEVLIDGSSVTYLGVNIELQLIMVLLFRVKLLSAGQTDCRVKPNTKRYAHTERPNFKRKQPRK